MARQIQRRRSARAVDPEPDEDDYEDEPNDDAEQGGGRRGDRSPRRGREQPTAETRHPSRSPERASRDRGSRSGRSGRDRSSTAVGKGWAASRANREKSRSFGNVNQVKIPEAPHQWVGAFLEDSPFFTYLQHWVNEVGEGQRKSYVCLGDDCPLCDIGMPVRNMDLYNVVDMTEDDPAVRFIEAGPDLGDRIYEVSEDELTKPLNQPGQYFSIKKTKKARAYAHSVSAVDEDKLYKLTDAEPLTDGDVDDFMDQLFDESVVKISTRRELQDLADEVDDG